MHCQCDCSLWYPYGVGCLQRECLCASLHEAMIYMKWVRFAIDVVLDGRKYVIINMDETSLSTVYDTGYGMKGRKQPRRPVKLRDHDPDDRSNVKTSLLATVCDSAALQPLLPQVILPKYTKRATPPESLRTAYASTGEPLEFWHGTGGWAGTNVIKKWATRIRSVIHSFNPDAWILLIWDCSQVHLNLQVASHLRKLGILVIMLPAKLTWLLQLCDVRVFRELKQRLRRQISVLRLTSQHGRINPGDWILCSGGAIREVIVTRNWEEAFDQMGLGQSLDSVTGRVRRAIDLAAVHPALPKRAEFGRMVNKIHHTDTFRKLHQSIVGHFLHVKNLPVGTPPLCGAVLPLPDVPPGRKRHRHVEHGAAQWEDVIDKHLSMSARSIVQTPHGRGDAVNRIITVPEAD